MCGSTPSPNRSRERLRPRLTEDRGIPTSASTGPVQPGPRTRGSLDTGNHRQTNFLRGSRATPRRSAGNARHQTVVYYRCAPVNAVALRLTGCRRCWLTDRLVPTRDPGRVGFALGVPTVGLATRHPVDRSFVPGQSAVRIHRHLRSARRPGVHRGSRPQQRWWSIGVEASRMERINIRVHPSPWRSEAWLQTASTGNPRCDVATAQLLWHRTWSIRGWVPSTPLSSCCVSTGQSVGCRAN